MATRPNPYLKKDPGDIMLAADWNEMQVQSREELHGHGHSGGDDANPIARAGIAAGAVDGTRIDPQSDVALKSLKVNGRVLLDEIDKLLASVAGLATSKLDRAGDTIVGSLTVKQDLAVGGNLAWGNSLLRPDQGGCIELGGSNAVAGTGTPYLDFHFKDKKEDYNVRLINDADRQLSIVGNLQVAGNAGITGALTVKGDLAVTGGFIRLSLAASGGGQLIVTNNPGDNRVYLEAFNTKGDGNAAELLLTGFQAQPVPQLSLYATNTTANGSMYVSGVMRTSAVNVDPGVADHVVTDGSFYRWSGQVYINVDDNLYIKDSVRGIRMHFDTVNGIFKTPKLRLGDKWLLSGDGDAEANDDWLRLKGVTDPKSYYGGFAASKIWTTSGQIGSSDLRLKHDIATIDGALAKVGAIRGVTYLWNDAPGDGEQAGVVAQEVEAVFPQVVSDGPDGMKGVNYNGMIGLLVEAIKEQQIQIDALRAQPRDTRKPQ